MIKSKIREVTSLLFLISIMFNLYATGKLFQFMIYIEKFFSDFRKFNKDVLTSLDSPKGGDKKLKKTEKESVFIKYFRRVRYVFSHTIYFLFYIFSFF